MEGKFVYCKNEHEVERTGVFGVRCVVFQHTSGSREDIKWSLVLHSIHQKNLKKSVQNYSLFYRKEGTEVHNRWEPNQETSATNNKKFTHKTNITIIMASIFHAKFFKCKLKWFRHKILIIKDPNKSFRMNHKDSHMKYPLFKYLTSQYLLLYSSTLIRDRDCIVIA